MAVTGYFDAVQQIYIAYYQRPADPAGLRFWAEHLEAEGGDISAIVDAFANSTEAQRLYGPIDEETIGDVIGNIYQSLFGRAPDDAGRTPFLLSCTLRSEGLPVPSNRTVCPAKWGSA